MRGLEDRLEGLLRAVLWADGAMAAQTGRPASGWRSSRELRPGRRSSSASRCRTKATPGRRRKAACSKYGNARGDEKTPPGLSSRELRQRCGRPVCAAIAPSAHNTARRSPSNRSSSPSYAGLWRHTLRRQSMAADAVMIALVSATGGRRGAGRPRPTGTRRRALPATTVRTTKSVKLSKRRCFCPCIVHPLVHAHGSSAKATAASSFRPPRKRLYDL